MPSRYSDPAQLLAEMTLAEKIGQLHQAPRENDIDPDFIRSGLLGSVICSTSAYAGNETQERVRAGRINELQRLAVEESRLGIPLLIARDVIHGHRTVAPIPLGQSASWSPEHIRRAAEIAAEEAYSDGIRWVFTPMLDIARDGRWGRIAEGFGEDPYLCGTLARAAVQGYQGDDMSKEGRVAACAKHFVGYGASEGGRDYNTTEITPYTMRNIYLPSFKAAVDAGVATIMSSFNELGGVPITGNRYLLDKVLREDWGFEGVIVSDWGAVLEMVEHGFAADKREAARIAINAGLDIDMAAEAYLDWLEDLIAKGEVFSDRVDAAVLRVLNLKFKLGLFDNPYTDESLSNKVQFTLDKQQDVLELARRSLVLLRNEKGLLPIKRDFKRIGLFGQAIDARHEMLGTWCLDGLNLDVITIEDGIRAHLGEDQTLITAKLPDEAVNWAGLCDVAIVPVCEHPHRSGEANSISTLDLPPGQTEFLEILQRRGVPVVLVVCAGRPIAIPPTLDRIDAILYAWHPGTMGGQAIADALFGVFNPTGKLTVTFPRSVGQIPIYYNRKATGRPLDPYKVGLTRYVDDLDSPLYPFGFGLSYSSYEYGATQVESVGDGFRVWTTVSNVSEVAGEEIVQLYIRDRHASMARPVRELKGYQRVALGAGDSKAVEFVLTREELGFYGADETWVTESGLFHFWIAPDSVRGTMAEATLA